MGTLPACYSGRYPSSGIEMELPENATVGSVAEMLRLPKKRLGMVTIDGKLSRQADPIPHGAVVKFFQKIAGG
jgi:hypothetical protein